VKEYATTLIMKEASGSRVKLTVAPRKGFYKGASDSRKLSVLFEGITKVPRSVTVNGKPASAEIKGSAAVVDIPASPVAEEIIVEIMK
jgi:hypothetical protein